MWFCANMLALNEIKTRYIIIWPSHMGPNLAQLNITINGIQLDRIGNDCYEQYCKFLGIHIDENLTWKYHINQVCKKVSRALFSIKQVKRALPTDCLKTLYYALVHSHFAYGIITWGNANNCILKPLVTLQKRAIRVIHNAHYNSHTEPKFKSSGILRIPDLLVYQSLIFLFDYLLNKLPPSFNGTFTVNCERPNARPTRQSKLLFVPQCHSAFMRKQPLFPASSSE